MHTAITGQGKQPGYLLIDLHYLPCIEYFARVLSCNSLVIEAAEHYQKQTYRNRCRVLTAQKVITLSIPVQKSARKTHIREVEIDYSQGWLKDHWRTISSAYGKAPFFPDYAPFFEKILLKRYKYLFDLNIDLLTNCLFLLGLKLNADITSDYRPRGEEGVMDLRDAILPQKEKVTAEKVKLLSYRQVFGNNFASNLSIADLLFCQGPASLNIIRQSIFL